MSRALSDLVRELTLAVIATGKPTARNRDLVERAEAALRPSKRPARVKPRPITEPDSRPRLIGKGRCTCGRTGTLFHSPHGPACATCIRGDGEGE